MKNNSIKKEIEEAQFNVIPDECGDSMWDAVLQQEALNNCKIAATVPVKKIDSTEITIAPSAGK